MYIDEKYIYVDKTSKLFYNGTREYDHLLFALSTTIFESYGVIIVLVAEVMSERFVEQTML